MERCVGLFGKLKDFQHLHCAPCKDRFQFERGLVVLQQRSDEIAEQGKDARRLVFFRLRRPGNLKIICLPCFDVHRDCEPGLPLSLIGRYFTFVGNGIDNQKFLARQLPHGRSVDIQARPSGARLRVVRTEKENSGFVVGRRLRRVARVLKPETRRATGAEE